MKLEHFVLRFEDAEPLPKPAAPLQNLRPHDFKGMTTRSALPESIAPPPKIAVAPTVKIETQDLTLAQAAEERRDPRNLVGLVMPVALIAPLASTAGGGDPMQQAQTDGFAWGLKAIGALDCPSKFTGAEATVAVLDTGIDDTHPAFAGVQIEKRNFTNSPDADVNGHGTHCAGTIFGRDLNGVKIGVAPGVKKAIIGKVLDDAGRGDSKGVQLALQWARQEGANIVSLSLGFDFAKLEASLRTENNLPQAISIPLTLAAYRDNVDAFHALMEYLQLNNRFAQGSVLVAAAGNESQRDIDPDYVVPASIPASAHPEVLSVAAVQRTATDSVYDIAPFSNIRPTLCGPGVDIVSAKVGGGLTAMSGTSMACPHIAGLAALWWDWAVKNGSADLAGTTRNKLRGECRQDCFVPAVKPPDRGEGLAKAPH